MKKLIYSWNEKKLRTFKSKIMDNVLARLDGKINYFYTKNQQKVLEELTYHLDRNKLPTDDIIQILIIIEEAKFKNAQNAVKKYLNHKDEWVRKLSLRALTMGFRLKKYTKIAIQFLLTDPEIDCRCEGALALGVLYFNTKNKRIIKLLLSEFYKRKYKSSKNEYIRGSIYDAILDIYGLGRVAREYFEKYNEQELYLKELIKNPSAVKKKYFENLKKLRKKQKFTKNEN